MPPARNIPKDILYQLYVVEKKTIKEVSEILNYNTITIAKYMKIHGIESRDTNRERSLIAKLGLTDEQFKEQLHDLYIVQQKSINKIARIFDVSTVVIRRNLKRLNIPLRDHKESNKVSNSGPNCNNWNGGKRTHSAGYIQIRKPEHPNADGCGYVYEHRLVMEEHLGRYLTTDEHVHHINEIKTDNRVENLQVLSNKEHQQLHKVKKRRK